MSTFSRSSILSSALLASIFSWSGVFSGDFESKLTLGLVLALDMKSKYTALAAPTRALVEITLKSETWAHAM